MRILLLLASCLAFAGCSFDLDTCGRDEDDSEPTATSAFLGTSSAAADAKVGEPLSIYVQYVVDDGESCTGDLGGDCRCTEAGPSPRAFDVVDLQCDDDACDVERVGDYVSDLREIVIVPRRAFVTVRLRAVSTAAGEADAEGVLMLQLES
jgi:hypothetical protein